jgi:hypothetical protein
MFGTSSATKKNQTFAAVIIAAAEANDELQPGYRDSVTLSHRQSPKAR